VRKLVFITQQVDPRHPALAATVPKIRALAELVDEVVVLADGAVPGVLPANCRVRTFRAPHKTLRGARFEAALAREVKGLRDGAVVAHMCPIYAVLAAPLARPMGIPVLLWFTHWRKSRLLSTAERLSNLVLSVDQRTFPLDSNKVVAIGHGIDVSDLPCVARPADRAPLTGLVLGRTSPSKGLETILRAVGEVPDIQLLVIGPSLTEEERLHRIALERLVIDLGLLDRVHIRPPVPRHTVPGLFAEVDFLVNDMREGATDKVVFEAAATCMPVIASNQAFDTLLPPELQFGHGDVDGLVRAIGWVLAVERNAVGRALREVVVTEHSVEAWADRVVSLSG